MILATAIASICIFIGALWLFGVVRVSLGAITTARDAMTTLRDKNLDDETRERAVQRASLQLFSTFASIVVRSAFAFIASILPIWLADLMDLAPLDDVSQFLLRWDVIVIAAVLMTAGYMTRRKLLLPR